MALSVLVLLSALAAAGQRPTMRLPAEVDPADWQDVARLTGLAVHRSPGPADVTIEVAGGAWIIRVGDAHVTMPAPRSEEDREDVAWLVASLLVRDPETLPPIQALNVIPASAPSPHAAPPTRSAPKVGPSEHAGQPAFLAPPAPERHSVPAGRLERPVPVGSTKALIPPQDSPAQEPALSAKAPAIASLPPIPPVLVEAPRSGSSAPEDRPEPANPAQPELPAPSSNSLPAPPSNPDQPPPEEGQRSPAQPIVITQDPPPSLIPQASPPFRLPPAERRRAVPASAEAVQPQVDLAPATVEPEALSVSRSRIHPLASLGLDVPIQGGIASHLVPVVSVGLESPMETRLRLRVPVQRDLLELDGEETVREWDLALLAGPGLRRWVLAAGGGVGFRTFLDGEDTVASPVMPFLVVEAGHALPLSPALRLVPSGQLGVDLAGTRVKEGQVLVDELPSVRFDLSLGIVVGRKKE